MGDGGCLRLIREAADAADVHGCIIIWGCWLVVASRWSLIDTAGLGWPLDTKTEIHLFQKDFVHSKSYMCLVSHCKY